MTQVLRGLSILVTRPLEQAASLAEMIAQHGGVPLIFPLLEIAPVRDLSPLYEAAAQLADYHLAIFISPNAVWHALPTLLPAWPTSLRAACVGPATAVLLEAQGIFPVIVPLERFDSEALLARPELARECMHGKKVLLLRGNGGRELLSEVLRERGARVDALTCYQRSTPIDGAPLRALFSTQKIAALTLSSSEGLRNLLALLDATSLAQARSLPSFVPHQRIADSARQAGFAKVILTPPTDVGLLAGLRQYRF